jgi:hypothetical protein
MMEEMDMQHQSIRRDLPHFPQSNDDTFDLNALLHPAKAFAHPVDVVRDPDLTLNEKRAILALWASDACAVEAAPALREAPGGRSVPFDDIMDALRTLDREADAHKPLPRYRRVLHKLIEGVPKGAPRRKPDNDRGSSIN